VVVKLPPWKPLEFISELITNCVFFVKEVVSAEGRTNFLNYLFIITL
jgi:hypothetical protein